jgi:hypothetical protein
MMRGCALLSLLLAAGVCSAARLTAPSGMIRPAVRDVDCVKMADTPDACDAMDE